MADFDYNDDVFTEEEPAKKSISIDTLDIFSILLVLGAVCLGAYFLVVFVNPFTAMNPLPPNTPIPPIVLPTATITPQQLAEAWTLTPTIQPTITLTPRPTFTPIPTNTPIVLFEPTETEEPPTPTATPGMPFEAEVRYIDASIIHPEVGCNWLGVGGTVTDLEGREMFGLLVKIEGTFLGKSIGQVLPSEYMVSGAVPNYGKSGFEFVIADAPVPSDNTLWLRVFGQDGIPLSEEIRFSTSSKCDENLVLIHFKQVR